jgi:hypothetical protein
MAGVRIENTGRRILHRAFRETLRLSIPAYGTSGQTHGPAKGPQCLTRIQAPPNFFVKSHAAGTVLQPRGNFSPTARVGRVRPAGGASPGRAGRCRSRPWILVSHRASIWRRLYRRCRVAGLRCRSPDRVTGGGHPPPVPTERGVRFSRTTLFDRWFTALRGPAAFRKEVAVLDAVTDISP